MSVFVAYLRSQADRRRSEADEHSGGSRSSQSAAALDSLAAFIEENEDVQADVMYRLALESIEFHIDVGQVGIANPGPETAGGSPATGSGAPYQALLRRAGRISTSSRPWP
jgi:hypothetical protein